MGWQQFLDQAFPHFGDWRYRRRIVSGLEEAHRTELEQLGEFSDYAKLETKDQVARLSEEKARAESVDDKTIRFLAALTIGFALIGVAGVRLVESLDNQDLSRAVMGIGVAAGIFLLDAAYLAIHSMRTERLFGYGTRHLLELASLSEVDRKRYRARDLWSQEQMNHRRSIRNEAVYLALRNGYLLIMAGAGVAIVGLIVQLCE